MEREQLIEEFQQKIGYCFKNKALLDEALTHASWSNEHGTACNNERLEFLGDAVLELVSSEIIYGELKDVDEGQLTKVRSQLVCGKSMSAWAKKHELGKLLKTGKSLKGQISDAMLENAGEAFFGAVFLDSDYETVRNVARSFLTEQAKYVSLGYSDPKTTLQELVQSDGKGIIPRYATLERAEPDSGKPFVAAVIINGREIARGSGKSIKAAEFEAAENALKRLGK